ncbi:MAG: DNA polymerase I [Gammaproteobacteria bacterium TMED134]|nr:MAG: DNA polymerase I [Gammaproteobacteria bacterium TMED134]
MDDASPLILVDGSSYLFRAYYALPDLRSSDGHPTGAIRGVISMLRRLQKEYPKGTIAVVFDAPGKTFRDDLYGEYKANRSSMPEDLREQIEPIHSIIRDMGLPLICVAGVEADDVIGTYAQQASDQGRLTVISTGDKDMAQLVDDSVTLVNTMTETTLDAVGVRDKFGVDPDHIVDYLALMGDSVDNIPGIPKVGPKTAAKWLNQYGSLDALIESADEIKGKVGESLREHLDQLPLSRALTEIKRDVALSDSVDALKHAEPNQAGLTEAFRRFEFKSWVAELDGAVEETAGPAPDEVPRDYQTILTEGALTEWVAKIQAARIFAFDTETTSVNYMQAEIVGFSFAVEPGCAAYLPVAHDYPAAPEQLSLATALEALRVLLEDPDIAIIGQNIKYDMSVLARYGVVMNGDLFDTMLESYVLNSVATRHNMDALAGHYLGLKTIRYEDVAGKGAKQLTFNQVPLETAADYAAEDADITLQLHQCLYPKLQAQPSLAQVFNDIDMPLVSILSSVERQGTLVDGRMLHQHGGELTARLKELTEEAWSLAGESFNLDSPKQLQAIFYDKLGLPVLKKTPGGQPSTAEPVLVDLARDYELPAVLLSYRGLAKLKSTYTDKLPLDIDPQTGRIHTSYHQAVAATGRLSSSDPNLQNIPIRNAEGRRIRQAFVAPPGCIVLAADYSQIELRIMAHLSEDEGLLNAFAANRDIHRATAAEVFQVSEEAISDEQRRSAKAINFGLIYGMSAFGLGRQLSISRTLAQDYIDRYFARYPGVLHYMDKTKALAAEQGYVETIFGRRLYLPEISSTNVPRRQAAERTAINAPMQGTAADIIKLAMASVQDWLASSGAEARMIMQVHDELVFEVAQDQLDEVQQAVIQRMAAAATLKVPLVVDAGVGANWDEAH